MPQWRESTQKALVELSGTLGSGNFLSELKDHLVEAGAFKKASASKKKAIDRKEILDLPNAPLSQNPALCGLYAFATYIVTHKHGLPDASLFFHITLTAHVYNALIQEGLVSAEDWSRMSELIRLQGPERLFFNETPSDFKGCWSKFWRTLGYDPLRLPAYGKVRKFVKLKDSTPRSIDIWSPITKIVWTYLSNSKNKNANLGREKLLNPLYQLFLKSKANPKERGIPKIIDHEEFLHFVRDDLPKELRLLQFNYIHLCEMCIRILQRFEDEFQDRYSRFVKNYDLNSLGHNSLYLAAGGVMFLGAEEKRSPSGRSATLKRAAEIIKSELADEKRRLEKDRDT